MPVNTSVRRRWRFPWLDLRRHFWLDCGARLGPHDANGPTVQKYNGPTVQRSNGPTGTTGHGDGRFSVLAVAPSANILTSVTAEGTSATGPSTALVKK